MFTTIAGGGCTGWNAAVDGGEQHSTRVGRCSQRLWEVLAAFEVPPLMIVDAGRRVSGGVYNGGVRGRGEDIRLRLPLLDQKIAAAQAATPIKS